MSLPQMAVVQLVKGGVDSSVAIVFLWTQRDKSIFSRSPGPCLGWLIATDQGPTLDPVTSCGTGQRMFTSTKQDAKMGFTIAGLTFGPDDRAGRRAAAAFDG